MADEFNLLRETIVGMAKANLGQHEDGPPYNNEGVFPKKVLAYVGISEPAPWCMAFAVWIVGLKAGNLGNLIKTGSVQAQVDHARNIGAAISMEQIVGGSGKIVPGDVMCEWEDELNRYAHSGVVTAVSGLTFVSIEGNTNNDGSREGYAVLSHTRRVADKTGSGHEKYCFIRTY